MDYLFEDIKNALNDQCYYAALFMALTIPDICLSIKLGNHVANDYINWFEDNMPTYKGYMSGKDCYVFRCAILHEGKSEVLNHSKKDTIDKFEILSTVKASHLMYMGGNSYNGVLQPTKLLLNLHIFCKDIVDSAKKYIEVNNLEVRNLVEIKQEYNDGFIKIK